MGMRFKFQMGMGMGMKSLKWEGIGTKKSVPAHLYPRPLWSLPMAVLPR